MFITNELSVAVTFIMKGRRFLSRQAWWKTQKQPGVASWLIPSGSLHSRAGGGLETRKDQHLRNTS